MDTYTTCFFVAIFVLSYLLLRRNRNLPPGPIPLPFIGNSLQLFGTDIRQLLHRYRKEYGDLFTLHRFNSVIVVLNGYETIRDICVKNSEIFSRKPHYGLLRRLLPGEGILFGNGEIWKQNKRLVIKTLKDFGMGKIKLQTAIHDEIAYLLDVIEKEGEQPFDIEYFITIAVSNIICSLVFGKRFDYEDEQFIDLIRRMKELIATDLVGGSLWWRYIPGDPFHVKRTVDNVNHLRSFYREKLREHNETYDENNIRDVIDVYIKQMKQDVESEKQSPIDEDEVIHIINDLFAAGTETTSTTLRFALICMSRNPVIQERLSDELKEQVPQGALPDVSDCKNLPYFQATVSETLRRLCAVPIGVRVANKDFQYQSFTIPKSARVVLNLESISLDEFLWNQPFEFNPSRFMEGGGLKEQKEHIPFGLGPRICAGESLARMELNLFLSALLHRFKFLPPEGKEPPSLDTELGFINLVPPYKLRAIRRK